ncbi:hypothetical protein ELQ35_14250 [Peribacillus cavernae]|uniref:PLP-dependent aminotransferase family protein n=1 Tax=Peribacillus cavernae TaxID=1674310 RepID=A0A433HHQ2_9BACI|nr:hypothetical protein [Peribacillus cavernae]MDQ0220992.1 DNA-binding transcriptional MocR family regulator [Peribacillus cavernae]RUQ27914.1 hypothetical protein ELQ35_14250 [Peribacillus cavernae]
MHLLLHVEDAGEGDLVEMAAKYGVKAYSPSKYWFDKEKSPPSMIMLGFGGMTEKEIDEGISFLEKAWFQ